MANTPCLRAGLTALFLLLPGAAFSGPQAPPAAVSLQDRLKKMMESGPGTWTPEQITTMARLRDAALEDSYTFSELRHLTDNIGPRLAGSAQAAKAVEYVAAEMRSLGAEVQLEKTTVPHWVRGIETGELTGWPGQAAGTTQKIMLTALGGSPPTAAEGLTAPVVVVNSFDELQKAGAGFANGKILLFNEPFDKRLAAQGGALNAYGQAGLYRAFGSNLGANAGAVAVLVRSIGGADYRLPHTGSMLDDPSLKLVPAAAVTAEDADLLANLTRQGSVTMHLTVTPQNLPRVESANVIADWKGSANPEQIVIVSGHLDSWDLGTGAIDDGAGVVAAMEAIHLMQKLGLHPRRTIRLVAWMNEEHGTDGANSYATDHAAEIGNHIGALESDLGAGHPGGITYAGTAELADFLKPVASVLAPIGAAALDRSPEAGEDINFLTGKGVPSFSPTQDSRFYFNYHHTAADTIDKVKPRELNENAAVMAVLAYALADSAAAAPR
jgi:carboxypeptidase Q